MKKGLVLVLLLLFSIVSLCACNTTEQYFVYGNIQLEITASGVGSGKLSDKIAEYVDGLEPVLSPTFKNSDLDKINSATEGESVICRAETMQIMAVAERVYNLSNGAYDPSVYPLVCLWKFSGDLFLSLESKIPPTDAEIAGAKTKVGFSRAFTIDYVNNTVTKNSGYGGAMLDFGGVAKGYAADKARALVNDKQKALINLGGNISAANNDYTIGIGNPRESETAYFGSFTLKAGECISTSGDYERYFVYEGKKYHHILDPSTGSPSNSGLISVSVICSDGALGDAASTAVMVLGKEKGIELINTLGLKAVLIDEELNYTVIGDLDFVKK